MAEAIFNFNGDIHIHFHGLPVDDFFDDEDFFEDEAEEEETEPRAETESVSAPRICFLDTSDLPDDLPPEVQEMIINAVVDHITQLIEKSACDSGGAARERV